MVYSAKLGRETLEIQKKDLLAANDRLARQYQTETDPGKRRDILGALYELTRGLFKSWRVWGDENRRDFEQEALLYLARALEAFNPERGPFVACLRWYILKAQEKVAQAGRETAQTTRGEILEDVEAEAQEAPDALYWAKVKRQCTDTEWSLLESRFFDGLSIAEAATKAGLKPDQAKSLYSALVQRIRLITINQDHNDSQRNIHPNSPVFTDEPIWVGKNWLVKRLSITRPYLKALLNPSLPTRYCPFYIPTTDLSPLQGGRIRYWETPTRGLVYPQILRRRAP